MKINEQQLRNQITVNLDDATAQQVEKIAKHYQRKPAELLRLILVPELCKLWAEIQRQEHQENQEPPTVAQFKL